MAGGAIVGYCAIGKVKIEAIPASIRIMAITHAKIGRSIKNFAMKHGSLLVRLITRLTPRMRVPGCSRPWRRQPLEPEAVRRQASRLHLAAPFPCPARSRD